MSEIVWHDIECGGYDADLALWRGLAGQEAGPVLDVGAGTGRVALDLAREGHEVVALDLSPVLAAELGSRAAGLPVEVVVADARDFSLGREFGLILVPMQGLQLLGGAAGRSAFLRCARAHMGPGGLLAAALAQRLEPYEPQEGYGPLPDMREADGVVWSSLPLRVVERPGTFELHRRREIVRRDGSRSEEHDLIVLDDVGAAQVAREAEALGFAAEPVLHISATEEYVGSDVVMLRAR